MSNARPSALRLQNNAISALLFATAVAAWAVLVWQQSHHAHIDMAMAAALHREVWDFLADWIDENNPVRVIDAFVDKLDLSRVGVRWSGG